MSGPRAGTVLLEQEGLVIRRLEDPADGSLAELARLLDAVFPDPDTVLELDRLQAFLAQPRGQAGRHFCVVVAEEQCDVVGGTIFSYVPATSCGFSEYLVVRKERHRQGIGRLLFDSRRAVLDALAREAGQVACGGLFIEADNPERTPPNVQARERETAIDTSTRLRLFAHLGFLRVDMAYVQPPLGPGKQPVSYLDLLFAAWDQRIQRAASVPSAWVSETVCPIWRSWSGSKTDCEALRRRLKAPRIALLRPDS